MKNNNTTSTAWAGYSIGSSSGSSSSKLKQANHSGLTPKTAGSTTNHKGNLGGGKSRTAPDGTGPVIGSCVKPRNAKGC